MALSQPMVAEEMLDAYPLARHRCLLDVGGGEGAFLAAAAPRAPSLELMLFDLPAVAMRGRERLASGRPWRPRRRVTGGDFLTDPLPKGADIVSLVRVILDHDDANALTILRAARRALGPRTARCCSPSRWPARPGAEADGRRLFRLLPARHGPRPAAQPRPSSRALLDAAGFAGIAFATGMRVLRTGIADSPSLLDNC